MNLPETHLSDPISSFSVSVLPDERTVQITGDLDSEGAFLLRDASAALTRRRTGPINVDLAGLTFIDSAGLNVLVEIAVAQHAVSQNLFVLNASSRTKRVFVAAGLASLL